jgi:hypothetical protein
MVWPFKKNGQNYSVEKALRKENYGMTQNKMTEHPSCSGSFHSPLVLENVKTGECWHESEKFVGGKT